MIDFSKYRWVIVNSSGGKDSQTALNEVVVEAGRQGYPRDQIVVSHQCLGEMEWKGTLDLVREQSDFYGLRLEISSYRNKAGLAPSLLDYVRKRGKWPDSKNRFCTSEFKRGPGGRVITKLFRESPGDILNVYGFRSQESPARAKKETYIRNARFSTKSRVVFDWLPIHDWTEREVWKSIGESGVPYHQAYDLGMTRLSCVFCIFAPQKALVIAGEENPRLLSRYVALEKEIGHTFKNGSSLHEVQEIINGKEIA